MENNDELKNMNECCKKRNPFLLIILPLLLLTIGGLIGWYFGKKTVNKENENNNVIETNKEKDAKKEVSEELFNNLLKIIGITDTTTERLISNQMNLLKEYGTIEISVGNKLLSNYNSETLYYLLNDYVTDNLLDKTTKVYGSTNAYCGENEEYCLSIPSSILLEVARKYGVNNLDAINNLKKDGDNYLLLGYGALAPYTIQHNLTSAYKENNIIIIDNSKISDGSETSSYTITYTFSLNNLNEYYLYSVNISNS